MIVRFTIPGEPMGKQRPKAATFAGHAKVYTPKETIQYENKVVMAYTAAYGGKDGLCFRYPDDAQLCVTINAFFQIPKSESRYYKKAKETRLTKRGDNMKQGLIRPTKKPDVDNITKIILDALNGIAYRDDSSVVEVDVRKFYAESPRVEVAICRLIM